MNNLSIVILSAGKGTRMNSELPKVLHEINKKSLINYVIEKAEALSPDEIIVIVGYKADLVKRSLNNSRFTKEFSNLSLEKFVFCKLL